MTPNDAIGHAGSGNLQPVYVVVGEESFLADGVVRELRRAALDGAMADFNCDTWHAADVDADTVIAGARTVPMMANRRFVLVRGVERWESQGERGARSIERMADYINEAIDTTCLVLVAQKLDGRRKLASVAKKEKCIVDCKPLSARELPHWLIKQSESRGHPMHRDVAELLAELSGPELGVLDDAVERLGLYVGEHQPIDEAAVSACVARVRTVDTWTLVDAVQERDHARALGALRDVYDPRDRGLPVIGAIAWSLRQVLKFRIAHDGGSSADAAAKAAGVYQPFRAKELAARAKRATTPELERMLDALATADRALKSSRRPADAILDDLVAHLVRRR